MKIPKNKRELRQGDPRGYTIVLLWEGLKNGDFVDILESRKAVLWLRCVWGKIDLGIQRFFFCVFLFDLNTFFFLVSLFN